MHPCGAVGMGRMRLMGLAESQVQQKNEQTMTNLRERMNHSQM